MTDREELLRRCAQQRIALAGQLDELRPVARFFARGLSLARRAARHPALLTFVSTLLLTLIRRGRWTRILAGGWLAARLLRFLRRV